jgi:hypothetical protein
MIDQNDIASQLGAIRADLSSIRKMLKQISEQVLWDDPIMPEDDENTIKHKDKFYLVNIDDTFNDRDEIIFYMPPFCDGDYRTIVMEDDKGLFILQSENYFKGCRDYQVTKSNVALTG